MPDSDNDVLGALDAESVLDSIEYKDLQAQFNLVSAQHTTEEAAHMVTISELAEAQENLSIAQNDAENFRRENTDIQESVQQFRSEARIGHPPLSYSKLDPRQPWNTWSNHALVYDANDFGFPFEDRTNYHGAFMANMRKRTTLKASAQILPLRGTGNVSIPPLQKLPYDRSPPSYP